MKMHRPQGPTSRWPIRRKPCASQPDFVRRRGGQGPMHGFQHESRTAAGPPILTPPASVFGPGSSLCILDPRRGGCAAAAVFMARQDDAACSNRVPHVAIEHPRPRLPPRAELEDGRDMAGPGRHGGRPHGPEPAAQRRPDRREGGAWSSSSGGVACCRSMTSWAASAGPSRRSPAARSIAAKCGTASAARRQTWRRSRSASASPKQGLKMLYSGLHRPPPSPARGYCRMRPPTTSA
jgi:hypothetical protein